MFTLNLIGVFGAMVAALLAWIPVLAFDKGVAEYGAVFVFVASVYASLTDRYLAKDIAKAYSEFLDFPNRPVARVAIFGAPLLIYPVIGVVVVFGYLCFHNFEQGAYLLSLYVCVCVAATVIAVVTVGLRRIRIPDELRARLGAKSTRMD